MSVCISGQWFSIVNSDRLSNCYLEIGIMDVFRSPSVCILVDSSHTRTQSCTKNGLATKTARNETLHQVSSEHESWPVIEISIRERFRIGESALSTLIQTRSTCT